MINYKKREKTNEIIVKKVGLLAAEPWEVYRRSIGHLDGGVHYFINWQGEVEPMRPEDVVAAHDLRQDAVYIAVNNDSDSAKRAVGKLKAALDKKYKINQDN